MRPAYADATLLDMLTAFRLFSSTRYLRFVVASLMLFAQGCARQLPEIADQKTDPFIEVFSPLAGLGGQTIVKVEGKNFPSNARIYFGVQPALFAVGDGFAGSNTVIYGIPPLGTPSQVEISVRGSGREGRAQELFRVFDSNPEINNLSTFHITPTTQLVIDGRSFNSFDPSARLFLGAELIPNFEVNSERIVANLRYVNNFAAIGSGWRILRYRHKAFIEGGSEEATIAVYTVQPPLLLFARTSLLSGALTQLRIRHYDTFPEYQGKEIGQGNGVWFNERQGEIVSATPEQPGSDIYLVQVRVPSDLPTGQYKIRISNDAGSSESSAVSINGAIKPLGDGVVTACGSLYVDESDKQQFNSLPAQGLSFLDEYKGIWFTAARDGEFNMLLPKQALHDAGLPQGVWGTLQTTHIPSIDLHLAVLLIDSGSWYMVAQRHGSVQVVDLSSVCNSNCDNNGTPTFIVPELTAFPADLTNNGRVHVGVVLGENTRSLIGLQFPALNNLNTSSINALRLPFDTTTPFQDGLIIRTTDTDGNTPQSSMVLAYNYKIVTYPLSDTTATTTMVTSYFRGLDSQNDTSADYKSIVVAGDSNLYKITVQQSIALSIQGVVLDTGNIDSTHIHLVNNTVWAPTPNSIDLYSTNGTFGKTVTVPTGYRVNRLSPDARWALLKNDDGLAIAGIGFTTDPPDGVEPTSYILSSAFDDLPVHIQAESDNTQILLFPKNSVIFSPGLRTQTIRPHSMALQELIQTADREKYIARSTSLGTTARNVVVQFSRPLDTPADELQSELEKVVFDGGSTEYPIALASVPDGTQNFIMTVFEPAPIDLTGQQRLRFYRVSPNAELNIQSTCQLGELTRPTPASFKLTTALDGTDLRIKMSALPKVADNYINSKNSSIAYDRSIVWVQGEGFSGIYGFKAPADECITNQTPTMLLSTQKTGSYFSITPDLRRAMTFDTSTNIGYMLDLTGPFEGTPITEIAFKACPTESGPTRYKNATLTNSRIFLLAEFNLGIYQLPLSGSQVQRASLNCTDTDLIETQVRTLVDPSHNVVWVGKSLPNGPQMVSLSALDDKSGITILDVDLQGEAFSNMFLDPKDGSLIISRTAAPTDDPTTEYFNSNYAMPCRIQ